MDFIRKLWLFIWLGLPCFFWGGTSSRIVCVHIGQVLPQYLEIALAQARLFNSDCPIVLIANAKALENFSSRSNVECISCESLPLTPEHEKFQIRIRRNDQVKEGFWSYSSERFLYLYDYMVAFGVGDVFHIENDVLLYTDLEKLLPIFQANYSGIATTFESEFKCIPGFVFIANQSALQRLVKSFAVKISPTMSDMRIFALFWTKHKEEVSCLPMIMDSYLLDHTPVSFEDKLLKKKKRHSACLGLFGSLFDGAAMGVFFDGLDPAKGKFPEGYLIKSLFDPSKIEYKWELDQRGRKVPYAIYGSEIYPVNNLHIASKRLERFTSLEWPW